VQRAEDTNKRHKSTRYLLDNGVGDTGLTHERVHSASKIKQERKQQKRKKRNDKNAKTKQKQRKENTYWIMASVAHG
jgi:hypothetical protein